MTQIRIQKNCNSKSFYDSNNCRPGNSNTFTYLFMILISFTLSLISNTDGALCRNSLFFQRNWLKFIKPCFMRASIFCLEKENWSLMLKLKLKPSQFDMIMKVDLHDHSTESSNNFYSTSWIWNARFNISIIYPIAALCV